MLYEVRHIVLGLPQSNPQLIKWEMVIWFAFISHLFHHSPFYTNLTVALLIPFNHLSPNIKWCMNRSLNIS